MVGESEEIKDILNNIANSLTSADGNATKLIRDVREALKGTSEPTVASSIRTLKESIHDEFTQLKAVLRDEGGAGRGTIRRPDDDLGSVRDAISNLTEKMTELLSRIERSTTSLVGEMGESDHGGGSGGRGGDRYRDYFERERYLSLTKILDDLSRKATTAGKAMSDFKDLLGTQWKASFNDLAFAAGQSVLQLTSLSGGLRNLHGVIKNEMHSFMSQGVFGSNALGPFEYMLEGPMRAVKGILFETDSLKSTLKTVEQSIHEGLQSPIAAFGRDTVELSRDFHEARRMMREQPGGFDSRAWMSTEAASKSLYEMVELMRRMGIHQIVTDSQTIRNNSDELNFLKVIAAMTGKSVEYLAPLAAAAGRENAKLQAIGRMSAGEAQMSGDLQTGLVAKFGKEVTEPVMSFIQQLRGYGRTSQDILQNSQTPDDIKRLFSTEANNMNRLMGISENLMREMGPGETRASRLEQLTGQIQRLDTSKFQQTGGPGSAGYQQGIYGSSISTLGQITQLVNVARGTAAPGEAVKARQQDFPTNAVIGTVADIWKNQIAPLFSSLPGAIGANTIALGVNTAALIGTRGIGGLLGSLAGGVGKVAKFGLGAAAIGGAAYGAYDTYENARAGNTGTAIGEGSGSVIGGIIGGAIAARFTGGFGTAIGASIGATVGNQIGKMFGSGFDSPSRAAPAVPSPQNMAGPTPAEQIFSSQNQGYQDASLGLQGQIIQAITQGNQLLGQIYGENARQTGYLRGDSSGAGGGVPGASARTAPQPIGRPDASYPYVASG